MVIDVLRNFLFASGNKDLTNKYHAQASSVKLQLSDSHLLSPLTDCNRWNHTVLSQCVIFVKATTDLFQTLDPPPEQRSCGRLISFSIAIYFEHSRIFHSDRFVSAVDLDAVQTNQPATADDAFSRCIQCRTDRRRRRWNPRCWDSCRFSVQSWVNVCNVLFCSIPSRTCSHENYSKFHEVCLHPGVMHATSDESWCRDFLRWVINALKSLTAWNLLLLLIITNIIYFYFLLLLTITTHRSVCKPVARYNKIFYFDTNQLFL